MSLNRPHTLEERQHLSSVLRGHTVSPETRNKISTTLQGHTFSDDTKRRISKTVRLKIPELRVKLKAAWKDPERRKRRLETMNSESYRRKIGDGTRERWANPEFKASLSGANSSNWNGGSSFEPYCPKFNNEFKERVRAFFGYKCIECGELQGSVKLGIHHVNYNKNSCCDSTKPMFVPLCRKCHAKTSHADKNVRATYEQKYIQIINERYGGECFVPKSERGAN